MPSPELREAVLESGLKYLRRVSRVAVALSGGIDSVVLLDLLASLRERLEIDLAAIHVNHGLSPNAAAWERFCADLCRERHITFAARRLQLARAGGSSLEAVAREARYEALATAAHEQGIGTIALVHHRDDQAETLMLQLLRGSSERGLAAMPAWRALDAGITLWRPFLTVTRAAIADHARARNLGWIEDESNDDVRHKRNFVRNRVFPVLESGFSGYRTSLARAAERAAESATLVDELAEADHRNSPDGEAFTVQYLRALGPLRARNLLRWTLSRRSIANPDTDQLAEFVRQALSAADDRNPLLALDRVHALHSGRGVVRILEYANAQPFRRPWHHETELALPHGMLRFARATGCGIDAESIPAQGFVVRSRVGGERCRVAANRRNRSLKNLFQEAGIPEPLRDGWPLIVTISEGGSNELVVAIPDIGVGVDWQCPPGKPGWTVAWDPK